VDPDGAFADPNSANRLILREIIRAVDIRFNLVDICAQRDVEQVIELGVMRVEIEPSSSRRIL
jgi:hypothetical protein